MSVSFRIFPERGLVYVRYQGVATVADGFAAFGEYARHPDCRPGQRQFVDLSAVAEVERDYSRIFALQARKAELFLATPAETMLVYYAPTRIARSMAWLALRSWEPFPQVVAVVHETEAGALAFLGLREQRLSDIVAATS